ncbi:MAG: hypothetical protein AABY14_04675 [Nanoarchaeota archaeon]
MSLERLATLKVPIEDAISRRFDGNTHIYFIPRMPIVEDIIRNILNESPDYNVPRIVILTSEMREEFEGQLRPFGMNCN